MSEALAHLIIQGPEIETGALKQLAKLTSASGIQRVTGEAFRLLEAQPNEEVEALCAEHGLDWGFVPEARTIGDFGLFVTDMDSTLIAIECIDEIADLAGVKPEVAAITEAAMRGEIDFRASLIRRVGLLAGLPASALQQVLEQRLRLNPGAERLLARLQEAGVHTVLVSGGFSFFTERLRERLGFAEAVANELEIIDDKLTGRLIGDIVDAQTKRDALLRWRLELGLTPEQTIAMGDGANDLEMFSAAGLSIAYRAKPAVRARASYALDHVGLDGLLPLLG